MSNVVSMLKVPSNAEPIAELILDSPCGVLWLAANESGLCYLRPISAQCAELVSAPKPSHQQAETILQQAKQQLIEYFAGTRQMFNVPLAPDGTAFQRKVWQQLMQIPYGDSCSYGELADQIQQPTAARAVGTANGANRIAIIIPCHRVIGKNGQLTGYAWGLQMKQLLLDLEAKSK
ncbi:methylated-DNA--[protein]-cysteine S-methyltransferase [Shewanella yunxiaonensis]|uniref:Methylated-DNA--protein-cysteine methyltransferase n=1 Tax=Shewanella yunxiaonensis TaxID=2829809 RepID=A0ABX7YXE9_9GAMM|nr:methylated-DNA--[protein]-cysteine S-methyltransferase [Shewanella yunxiaonensis]QUN06995.1 methylated-DNA--[protein]-cysteine S-methyltransferase [Shewanella yunxiaonensis]